MTKITIALCVVELVFSMTPVLLSASAKVELNFMAPKGIWVVFGQEQVSGGD